MTEPVTGASAEGRHQQIAAFLEGARWFGGKGRGLSVTDVRRLGEVAAADPQVVVDLVEVTYDDGDVELYQLPLALYVDPEHRLDHAFVGWWEDSESGWVHAYDAPHDRVAMAAYLRAFNEPAGDSLTFHRLPGDLVDPTAQSTLFTGEQSNSSVAFGDEALLKIFRRVTPGVNPDIEIHDVLTRAGSDNVAHLLGWIEYRGGGFETGAERPPQPPDGAERPPQPPDGAERPPQPPDGAERPPQPPEGAGGEVVQLAMLQQFLRTASDGWELALASVRNLFAEADLYADEVGGDFAGEAQRLGEAVGRIHALLAEHFPSSERSPEDQAALGAAMTSRLEAAILVVPQLVEHAPDLRQLYAAAGALQGDRIQRIHGDLHLGQTLRTVKGWKVVDFEGEPAKPLADRVLPDSPWRDVAGMLRSFDYAPRVVAAQAAAGDDTGAEQRHFRAAEWSARNQHAFLEAYAGRALTADEQTLLAAYIADKAVYECVYEARNRPAWLAIPLAALGQIEVVR